MELLEQCHFIIKRQSKDIESNINMGGLLTWLGSGLSPSVRGNHWLPLARAAEICLQALADPLRALGYISRGLLENFENSGLNLLKFIDKDSDGMDNNEYLLLNPMETLKKYHNNEEIFTAGYENIGLENISNGELFFLYFAARSNSYASREPTATDMTRAKYLRKAVKIYNLLMNFKSNECLVEYIGNIVLDLAVCTGDLGEVSRATGIVRSALSGEECSSHTSQLLHLLALLTSCAGDDAQVMGTSVALCKRASESLPSTAISLSGRPTFNLHPHPNNTDIHPDTDNINLEINNNPNNHTNTDDINNNLSNLILSPEAKDNDVDNNCHISVSSSVSVRSPNAGLSLAMLEWSSGETEKALKSIDYILTCTLNDYKILKEWENNIREYNISISVKNILIKSENKSKSIFSKKNKYEYDEYYDTPNSPPRLPVDVLGRLENPHVIRGIIDVVIMCSGFYRRAGKSLKAKSALEDGWQLLFTPHREALYGINDILLEGEKGLKISEHKRIDLLRYIPTLTGWRLSEGSGWDAKGYPDLEADVLCEAALQAEKSNISEELLLMALSLCPLHPSSLIALANIELKKIELNTQKDFNFYGNLINNDNDKKLNQSNIEEFYTLINNENKLNSNLNEKNIQNYKNNENSNFEIKDIKNNFLYDDVKAYQYAVSAVNINDLNPESWHVLGRVYQALGLCKEAGEAFMTSLECLQNKPIRKFSSVLNDSDIRPLKKMFNYYKL